MKEFDAEFVFNYISEETYRQKSAESFTDRNLIYDYNEVQELFLDENNYQVYIAGPTGLHKVDMLQKMIFNLIVNGVENRNIVYLDCTLPFVRNLCFEDIFERFAEHRNSNQSFYLIINEIEMMQNWQKKLVEIHNNYSYVKVLCSCSIPHLVHEYFFDNPDDYSKIVVLSNKNKSNTKHKSDTFGVYNQLKYNIKNNICEIKGMTKEGKNKSRHSIPNEINGYPVKIIASGAFHHRSELLEIDLPDSVEYIGDYAFTKCDNLQRIKLPANLKYIGECAFLGATCLDSITGGDKTNHIGNSALYGTKWLKEKNESFITLGRVLYQYKGLDKTVTVPDFISTIGHYAFSDAEIETIDLLNIIKIEEGAFFNCRKLKSISNYTLKFVNAFQFYNCDSLLFMGNIPQRKICQFAFYNCTKLSKVKARIVQIENNAFENCTNLQQILPLNTDKDGILNIASCSFWNTSLQDIELHTVKFIGKFAFTYTKINAVFLDKIKTIEDYAFAFIESLKLVKINEKAVLGKAIFFGSGNIKKAYLSGNYTLNSYFNDESKIEEAIITGKKCVDNISRNNKCLKRLEIDCKKIGNWAFYQNSNLSFVKLNVEEFGAWCFAYCDNLENIDIPEIVNYIEMNCFRYCHNLKSIVIRNNDTPVLFGANTFYSTAVDKKIIVKNRDKYLENKIWKEYENNLYEIYKIDN